MTIDFALPEHIRIPFQNMDWWQGVETSGFIKADPTGLIIEFQVIKYEDSVWTEVKSKSPVQEANISLEELDSVALKQGWVETMLEIKANSLKPLSALPGHQQGQVMLCIAGKDIVKAKELVSTMQVRLSENELRKLKKDDA